MTDFDPTPRSIAKQQARAAAATALTKWRHRAPDPPELRHTFEPYTWDPTRCGYIDGDHQMCGYPEADHPRPVQPCRHCGNPNHTAPTCPQKANT